MRKLETPAGVVRFKIGRGHVAIYLPDGKKRAVDLSRLTGRSWDQIGEGRWDGSSDGMITPYHVRRYLERFPEPVPLEQCPPREGERRVHDR